jgi:hemerythrin-like domain-containing protein
MPVAWDEQLGRRLQEERTALVQLGQVLRAHLATQPRPGDASWLDALRAGFDRLYAHVARTISMKEQDGYLEAILRHVPTLARQVASIRSENAQLLRLADGVRHDLGQFTPTDKLLLADATERILRFLDVLKQHEQRENMLVLFAFNQDLGSD